MSKFSPSWEAQVIEEGVVATGKWYYQNDIAYHAKLVKQVWNYGSRDLPELDEILEVPYCDYIDFNVSDEGVLYYWVFTGPSTKTTSPTFATYFQARDHLDTYGYKHDITW
jgi:hypothetical protein